MYAYCVSPSIVRINCPFWIFNVPLKSASVPSVNSISPVLKFIEVISYDSPYKTSPFNESNL